jgi:hypothetical protein
MLLRTTIEIQANASMNPENVAIHYALLGPSHTPQPCSRETWNAWIDSPRCNLCLHRERLDDYVAELDFTGSWSGAAWETSAFFAVTIHHPHHRGVSCRFATYEQARQGIHRMLNDALQRAQDDSREYH